MEARTKNKIILTSTIVAATLIAVIAVATFAYPATSQDSSSTTTSQPCPMGFQQQLGHQRMRERFQQSQATLNIPVGTAFHLSSIQGEAKIAETNDTVPASLDLTAKVTDQFSAGYTIELAGTITFNDVTYTITSANGLIGPQARHGGIQGYAEGSDGSQAHFLIGGEPVMNFESTTYFRLYSEFKTSQTYFLKFLVTTIS